MKDSLDIKIAAIDEDSVTPALIPADFADADMVEDSTGCVRPIIDFISEGGILVFALPTTKAIQATYESVPAWAPAGKGK